MLQVGEIDKAAETLPGPRRLASWRLSWQVDCKLEKPEVMDKALVSVDVERDKAQLAEFGISW